MCRCTGASCRFGERLHGINALTAPAFDPVSKQPELKHTAVRVERAALPWSLVAFAYVDGGRDPVAVADELREIARELSGDERATCLPAPR